MIVGVRLVLAPDNGRVPIETIFDVFRVHPEILIRGSHNVRIGLGANVEHADRPLIAAAEYIFRIVGIECQKRAFAAGGRGPACCRYPAAAEFTARDRDRRTILLAGVDPVRKLVIDVDPVKLRRRHIALGAPAFAAVECHGRTAVIRDDEIIRVVRVDPQVVKIAVRAREVLPRPAAVIRTQSRRAEDVDRVLALRVDKKFDVIPGPLRQTIVVRDLPPAFAGIGRNEQAALILVRIALDQRPDLFRVRTADGDRHLAHFFGQAFFQLFPGLAAIDRLVKAAARAAADHFPRQTAVFPHRGVQYPRVGHIHRQLGGTCFVVDEENVLPRHAAVHGLVYPALRRMAVQSALSRDKDDVRVLRVDDDPRDVLRFVEPHLLPRLAGVGRAIHTVAVVRHNAANGMFAHPDIDDVRVALGDGDRTDRAGLEIAVRDVPPADAHVLGLPEPAAGRSHVISLRVADDAGAGI